MVPGLRRRGGGQLLLAGLLAGCGAPWGPLDATAMRGIGGQQRASGRWARRMRRLAPPFFRAASCSVLDPNAWPSSRTAGQGYHLSSCRKQLAGYHRHRRRRRCRQTGACLPSPRPNHSHSQVVHSLQAQGIRSSRQSSRPYWRVSRQWHPYPAEASAAAPMVVRTPCTRPHCARREGQAGGLVKAGLQRGTRSRPPCRPAAAPGPTSPAAPRAAGPGCRRRSPPSPARPPAAGGG